MKFVHSADWQLGARFTQFGSKAQTLRKARIHTLNEAVHSAVRMDAEAFLIAGDLFADNQVDDVVIESALGVFAGAPKLPIFILPGNHDPYTGPGCLWERTAFKRKPNNVTILMRPEILSLGTAALIASPLLQKVSTIDPSLKIADMVLSVPDDQIRIGITHGALAIPGKHKLNDFPISLEAASRASLDYLAVGHWHNHQVYDNGRLVMPGTPEPDAFDQAGAGSIILAQIERRGEAPKVELIPTATLQWESLGFDLLNPEQSRMSLALKLDQLKPNAAKIVARITLSGPASPSLLEDTRVWLAEILDKFLIAQIQDDTTSVFTAAEIEELKLQHPMLASTITDLLQIEHLVRNSPLPPGIEATSAIPLADVQDLLTQGKIDISQLDGEFFRVVHRLLSQKLKEACS